MSAAMYNPDGTIIRTPEYNEFMQKLRDFHRQRGTENTFDPEPRVGTKHINLLQLYTIVVQRGGYDKVSDEKLAWRTLGSELQLGSNNLPAQAFSLKTAYYKNLAAYEIKTVYNKEPPPKEILEDLTAKGGNLLTRTLENYKSKGKDSRGDDDMEGTPGRDDGAEDTPGSGGRSTRGLRQAPPQRQIFQPDTNPARQTRNMHNSTPTAPPPPRGASTYNPPSNPDHMSQMVANYEPRPPVALSMRAVSTPGNDLVQFAKRAKELKEQALLRQHAGQVVQPQAKVMLPGTGYDGPNIYVRCLQSLKSPSLEDKGYALHHLVKISKERGDKFKFDAFSGLAEALIDTGLMVGNLFYDVNWSVSYLDDFSTTSSNLHILNGVEGTRHLLDRLQQLNCKSIDDVVLSAGFSDKMLLVNEVGLTLRNMVILDENAYYAARLFPFRDFIVIILNLPDIAITVEVKHYALEIAEQITRHLALDEKDPLYLSLLDFIVHDDRGMMLSALRAVSRIAMDLEAQNHLKNIPASTIKDLARLLLLDDNELQIAVLDFFYQYTAVVANVDILASDESLWEFVSQLVHLLSHDTVSMDKELWRAPPKRLPAPTELPPVPEDLSTRLLALKEPERSSQWLKCMFEEDDNESITQIALWQAYQTRFASTVQDTGVALLVAADFIKNVSTTFADRANAQVEAGPVQKFIIKGIRIRAVPVDFDGKEYTECQWMTMRSQTLAAPPQLKKCGSFHMGPAALWEHILVNHLGATKNEAGQLVNAEGNYRCAWSGCSRYHSPESMRIHAMAVHIKQHLPFGDTASGGGLTNGTAKVNGHSPSPTPSLPITTSSKTDKSEKQHPKWYIPAKQRLFKYDVGPVDDRGEATGISLCAVLVLRNLARNLPKTATDSRLKEEYKRSFAPDSEFVGIKDRVFKAYANDISACWAHNIGLKHYLADLIPMIQAQDGDK